MPLNQKFACGETVDNRYQLDIEVHSGRWGEVFRATDRRDNRPVAVRFFSGTAHAEEFIAHGRRLASLRAPGLSTPIAFGAHRGVLYAVSRWAAGQTLEGYLEERGPLSLEQILLVLDHLLQGLSKAHELNLAHGLLRPSKIVVSDLDQDRARVTIVDLHIWRLFELASGQEAFPESNLSRRILRYSGPEILQQNAVMVVSDVYSLGLLVIEMLTGRPALDENHRVALIAKLLDPTPIELRPELNIGPLFREFLTKLLAKDPAQRLPNANAVYTLFQSQREEFLSEAQPQQTPSPKDELFGGAPTNAAPLAEVTEDEAYEALLAEDANRSELFGAPMGSEAAAAELSSAATDQARRHTPNSSLLDSPTLDDFDPAIIADIPQATEVQRFPSPEDVRALTPIGEPLPIILPPKEDQDSTDEEPQRPVKPAATKNTGLTLGATIGLAAFGLAILLVGAFILLKPNPDSDSSALASDDDTAQEVEEVIRHKIRINTSPPALRVQVQGRPSGMSPMEIEVRDDEFPLQIQARLNAENIVTHTLQGPQEELLIEFD